MFGYFYLVSLFHRGGIGLKNRAFDSNIGLPDWYIDYTKNVGLSDESDGESLPDEYSKIPEPEADENLEVEMDNDDIGNDPQTRRLMRALQDTTTDYALFHAPIPMD